MAVLADKIEIRIDGNTFNEEYDFSDIQLVQELQKPNEFRFLMHKKAMKEDEQYIRFSLSKELLGKTVEYFLSTMRDDDTGKAHTDVLEFSGIIFHVNVLRKNLKAGLVIEVIAYSPDYLLLDNPHCWSYEDATLKEIVTKTLEPYEIPILNNPRMDEEIPYTVQYNETNYAFINRLARRFGEWLYYNGKELVFGKVDKLNGSDPFHIGYDILNYQYHLDLGHLNFTHAHHDYAEYGNTRKDGYSFTDNDMHNLTDIAYDNSKSLYAKETFQHLKGASPEGNFDETEYSAQTQSLGKKAQMTICQGSSNRADLRIGSIFKIEEYYDKGDNERGTCSHDELLVCKIIHTTDVRGKYENVFTAIPATCDLPPYNFGEHYPKAETQRAVVMDNQDPEELGRIRVQFLWQKEQDDNMITPWLRIAQPHGGDNKGFYFIPEIGEEVMVGFENGNAEKPYITGTLYHEQQRPGNGWYSETNDIKAIRTRNGHTIEIHDEENDGFIRIYDNEKFNYILTFSTDDKLIKLQSTGNIELYAENNIILEAGNHINMKAGVDLNREAGENINETAGNNITTNAKNNIATAAKANITINAGNDMDTSIGNNESLSVGSNQIIEIGANKDESIAEKYQLSAETFRIEASDKMLIYSKNHEQKADSAMKLDGGNGIDLYASSIKIN